MYRYLWQIIKSKILKEKRINIFSRWKYRKCIYYIERGNPNIWFRKNGEKRSRRNEGKIKWKYI